MPKSKNDPLIFRAGTAALISFIYMLIRYCWKHGYKSVSGKGKLGLSDQAIINGLSSATMTPIRKGVRKIFRNKKLPRPRLG